MKLCIPDAGDRLRLTESWEPTISVYYENRDIFSQLKGEDANPEDFDKEIEFELPSGTLLEVSKVHIKNSKFKPYLKFSIVETSHREIDPQDVSGKKYIQFRVYLSEVNGVGFEFANDTKNEPPEIDFPNVAGYGRLPRWDEPRYITVDGEKRFKVISRTDKVPIERSRRKLVPTEENDEYETIEEYYEDNGFDIDGKSLLPKVDLDSDRLLNVGPFRFPRFGDQGGFRFVKEMVENGVYDDQLDDEVDSEEVVQKLQKVKNLFTYETVSVEKERKKRFLDLYDLEKEEWVYKGYEVGSSLKSRVRKIVKEEHENALED